MFELFASAQLRLNFRFRVTRKNISQVALQSLHDLRQSPQGDALIASFQPVQSGRRKSNFARKFGESLLPASPAKKLGKLLVERARHTTVLPQSTFRMRNIFRFWNGTCIYLILVIMNAAAKLKILVADDETSVTFSIHFALKNSGHQVEMASDGEQALAKVIASPHPFDLLITDNNMPRLAGIELVARLRSHNFQGKIIVLSAHLSGENRDAYTALGVDMMISKPFDIFELRQAIDLIATSHSDVPSSSKGAFCSRV